METPLVPPKEPNPPIGRAREIEYLVDALDAVERGERRAVMLVGGAGQGKSTLLRYVRTKCVERKMIVVNVRAPAAAGLPPLFPIGDVVGDLVRGCRAMLSEPPEIAERIESALRSQSAIEFPIGVPQLAETLDEVSARRRIGLLFDDYQWAPPDGTSLLTDALRIVEQPVFFVGSFRLEDRFRSVGVKLPESTGDLVIDQLQVRGLEVEHTHQLLERTLEGPVLPSLASTIHVHTQGNPLFSIELANRWRLDRAIERVGAYWSLRRGVDHPVPGSLAEMLSTRLERLDEHSKQIAGVLALLGHDCSFGEMRSITGTESPDLVQSLGRLVQDGVIQEEGKPPKYSLANPLFGSTVRALLRPTEEALIHQSIYQALINRQPPAARSELAHHAVRALEEPREFETLLVEAADEADRVGSYEEAAGWHEVLTRRNTSDNAYGERLNRWATALCHFDPQRAVEVFSLCLSQTGSAKERVSALRGRAQAFRFLGRLDEALIDLDAALLLATSKEHYEIRHLLAVNHGIRGNLDTAESILHDLQKQDASILERAMVAGDLAMIAFARGRLIEAIERWSEVHDMCDEYSVRIRAIQNLVWGYLLVGKWSIARGEIESAIKESDRMGDGWNLFSLLTDAARLNAWEGKFPEAIDYCARASNLAVRLGSPVAEIECADAWGTVHFESRKYQSAVQALGSARSLIRQTTEKRESASTLALFAEACIAVGDLATAFDAIQEARDCLLNSPVWSCAVERVDAEYLDATGSSTGALEKLLALVDRSSVLPFEQAKIRVCLGRMLARSGNRALAISELRAASHLFKTLGCSHRVTEVDGLLTRITPKPRGRPRDRAAFDFTARELEVLRLVVAGKSDAEIGEDLFISPRTASKHVQNMLSKTRLRRRTELIAFAIREGLV